MVEGGWEAEVEAGEEGAALLLLQPGQGEQGELRVVYTEEEAVLFSMQLKPFIYFGLPINKNKGVVREV